jgi:two-component system phosphate regulon response regulator OmpR
MTSPRLPHAGLSSSHSEEGIASADRSMPAEALTIPIAPSQAGLNGPSHIWILDDDERLCSMLSKRIVELGWRPRCFFEPRGLDAELQHGQPDLLVLDEMLPGRSGSDLLAGLRQRGFSFPVLMLSALRSSADRIAGLEAGADDYLGKPFEFRELQLRILKLLDLQSRLRGLPSRVTSGFRVGSIEFRPAKAELRSSSGSVHRISRGDAYLLQALCQRPGEVIGRQILARSSGSLVDARQSRSIDVRMSRLRRLLEALMPEQGDVIESCRGIGYRLRLPVSRLDEEA